MVNSQQILALTKANFYAMIKLTKPYIMNSKAVIKMSKFKILLSSAILSLLFMFSNAETLNGINVFIINNSEMSVQTTISEMRLNNNSSDCTPFLSEYNIATTEPRSNKSGTIRTDGENICELDIATFVNGNTCFTRLNPAPANLEIIIPNDLGAGICNRIFYRYN